MFKVTFLLDDDGEEIEDIKEDVEDNLPFELKDLKVEKV